MERNYTFENFITEGCNEDALLVIREYIAGYMYFPGVLLYGENGSGKTHLLHACASELEKKGEKVLLKSANSIAEEIYYALGAEKKILSSWLFEKYEEYDALLIDDLWWLVGREAMQDIFREIIANFITDGKPVILTLDKEEGEYFFEKNFRKCLWRAFPIEIFKREI